MLEAKRQGQAHTLLASVARLRLMRSVINGAARATRTARCGMPRAFSTAAKEKLFIFDTTLRDGEQSPGATLTADEKVQIAEQLSRLGVDICEAGFPIASQGDFEAVSRIAKTAGQLTEGRPNGVTMRIAGLARANEKDIARTHEAVHHAPLHRIHTFLASSDIHLEHKLNMSRSECLAMSAKMVAFARTLVDDIEFSPEDAGRSDPAFLAEVCQAVIEAGASTINLPDTVGYTLPKEYGSLFAYLIENVPTGGKEVIWSTHCHDDLGLATANTLAAVQQGARQVEVTLNSLGERAGNTSLEEVVMALRTRPALFPVYCDIDTKQIMRTSKMVASFTGISVQPNKAIVGANAFAHESGIHQHGVLKHSQTYEIMTPERCEWAPAPSPLATMPVHGRLTRRHPFSCRSVGLEGQDGRGSMVLGKHSGKAAYRQRLIELGYADVAADADALGRIVEGAKAVADHKKTISDQDLEALIGDKLYSTIEPTWELRDLVVASSAKDAGKRLTSTATVTLFDVANQTEKMEAAIGIGTLPHTHAHTHYPFWRASPLSRIPASHTRRSGGCDIQSNHSAHRAARPTDQICRHEDRGWLRTRCPGQ